MGLSGLSSTLLKRQPRLFVMRESARRDLISRVLDMGFRIDSRMLVHAVYAISCMSGETFSRKLELFRSFGFSRVNLWKCLGRFRVYLGIQKRS